MSGRQRFYAMAVSLSLIAQLGSSWLIGAIYLRSVEAAQLAFVAGVVWSMCLPRLARELSR